MAKDKKKDAGKGKSRRQSARKQQPRKKQNRIQLFFRETIGELRKVTWPTRKELYESTILVIVSVMAVSIFIGVVDFVFNKMLQFFAQNI